MHEMPCVHSSCGAIRSRCLRRCMWMGEGFESWPEREPGRCRCMTCTSYLQTPALGSPSVTRRQHRAPRTGRRLREVSRGLCTGYYPTHGEHPAFSNTVTMRLLSISFSGLLSPTNNKTASKLTSGVQNCPVLSQTMKPRIHHKWKTRLQDILQLRGGRKSRITYVLYFRWQSFNPFKWVPSFYIKQWILRYHKWFVILFPGKCSYA